MKKLILILLLSVISVYGFSQYVLSNLNSQSISTCSGTFTLGSYSAGQTFTMTVCSNDPIARHMTLYIGGGYSFPAGTSLCVYDGQTTGAPLLICYNNTTVGGTIAVQATNMNESGCLTFVFTGTATGASWSGTFSCNFVCQPRQVDIVSAVPAIQGDGYINVCWDETANTSMPVEFTAQGTYPSTAYPCTDATNTFFWNFQDGTPIVSGVGMTTVTHNFPARQGYTVIVTIEDSEGCVNTNSITQRVRVSRAPTWNTTTTATNPDEICMGEPVTMCGYYSGVQWSSAVIPVNGQQVALPDTPPLCFNSTLLQNAFEPGQTLTTVNDLLGIHMSICHTYIGDLTFYIQCPNGQEVQLGIQGGGGCNLGNPPSAGFWYNITPTATTTMQNAASSQTTLAAGNYASYASLAGLVGCPLNGLWTIRICDNWSADAGTIFGWYLEFNPSLYPEIWSYTPTYTPTSWEGLYGSEMTPPANTNCATGTYLTTATPDVNSLQPFIFTITDNFGCEHDTALYVNVLHALDPNCCIIPSVSAGADVAVCALTYQLNATPFEFPTSTGYWELISGPSTAAFQASTAPVTNVTVGLYGTYVFAWHELYMGNPGCANTDQVTITFNETFDPTLTAVANMCVESSPFLIQAVNFGTLSCSPNPSLLNTTTGQFDPSIPGTYTITNTVDDPCSGGPLTDNVVFTVYDAIDVLNFAEVCGPLGTPTYFNVSWDVVGSQGGPFTGYLVNGITQANPHFEVDIVSPNSYNYTVTDVNGCSDFVINGFRDCGCPLYAGTMGSLQTVVLCANECTEPDVTHNGNEETDGGAGMFEFMIHTGNNQPLAYSTTPNFCLNDFGGAYNTIYYVSAICGLPSGGHANITTGCYSISAGTPVMWMQNPIAHAGSDKDTCGLIIRLNGNVPEAGMYGYWSSSCEFFAVGGTSHTQPNALVMGTAFNDCTFTWNIVNGECVASDDVVIGFLATPNPYAGDDIVICGNTAEMAGVPSLSGTTFSWSGNGTSFNPQSSLTAESQVGTYGTYQYTLTENNGACFGQDQVLVTYIQPPSPLTTPNIDTVCGTQYDLIVITAPGADGVWAAYEEDGVTLANPQPIFSPSIYSTSVHITIGNYPGNDREIQFVWTETNQVMGIECTAEATKIVVFAKSPIANVGASDEREICGNCITFDASTVGIDGYEHFWIPKVNGEFTNAEGASAPDATYCVDVPAAFGDTAYIDCQFLWAVKNGGCISIDTMHVIFYQQPVANAGIDDAICGFNYELGAVYDITETSGYTPSGIWSVHNAPAGESAAINPLTNDTVQVTVTATGIWNFIFRENNSNATFCYTQDTVQIEFVEEPVITAGEDFDVCGTSTTLEGISGGFEGSWLPTPGAVFEDYSDPTTDVDVGAYGTLTFTWLEANQATTETLSCSSQDDVEVTFWRVPTATILTDPADSTVCGLTFEHLRAEAPGSGIAGNWFSLNPAITYVDVSSNNTSTTVPSYGYHNFYWIEETGPELIPGFCNDTAGPLTIRFIEIPDAYAGGDTLFCGYTGELHAIPSVGTGVWSTPSVANIAFANQNDPESQVTSNVINTGNPTYPFFELIWTEDNSNGCTDKDTMQVIFARIPTSQMQIIPPKCFGEPATIAALEDTVQQYTWNFYGGLVDSIAPANISGGLAEYFIYWNDEDTAHRVSMIATNYWGCQSPINIDTVQEPPIPLFDVTMVLDTCALGKGGIVFAPTIENSFFWTDPNVGPAPGTPITEVYDLPAGEYGIRVSYLTPNIVNYSYYINTFGTANCIDTMIYEIETIGMIDAEMSVSADVILEDLVAPNATVIFLNTSDYDDVSKRCEWHFDDGTIVKNCDELIEHIYTEAGCYEPFLIVMNRDLPECRDTARLETCVFVDNASKLEVPNVFSPNADGINDFFQVKAQTLRTFSGVIVNRWGRTVFEWTNWEDYEAGWDGKLSGGTDASPGVYYYVITAEGMDDAPYEIQGALHLMRE